MNILDQIVARKRAEADERKTLYPVQLLERSVHFAAPVVSLKQYILRPDKCGIIAEFKKKSPSAGWINPYAVAERVSIGYMQAGASALSVLTDTSFFGGSNHDLTAARNNNYCPVLRKDFIVDAYQVIEARAIGADAILLIAAILTSEQVRQLATLAHTLQMEVLLEIHEAAELAALCDEVDIIGVNNRNLRDFSIDTNRSLEMLSHLPEGQVLISESGIDRPETAVSLHRAGYDGFLVGSGFMKHNDPPAACAAFIRSYKQLRHEDKSLRTEVSA